MLKMNKTFMMLMLTTGLFFGACTSSPESSNTDEETVEVNKQRIIETIDVATFKQKMEDGKVQIVDVRSPNEWDEGIIPGAHLIDIYDDNFRANLSVLNGDSPILVYCKSGGRSGKASKIMYKMGFPEVYNLDGGITAWQKAGMSVTKR